MKKESKKNLIIVIKVLVLVVVSYVIFYVFAIGVLLGMFSCEDLSYCEDSEWKCTEKEFKEDYAKIYIAKIQELKQKYSIDCHERTEMNDVDGDNELEIYLYSEKFTIYISATNCGGIYGSLDVKLCYFGDMDAPISEYSSQQNLIDFINDFVRYVGYDTKHDENDNHFERLYNECVAGEEKKNSARYAYHFDHLVGELGYYVYLNDSSYTYLYQMSIEDDQKIHANCFIFKGLLKTEDR